MHLQKTIQSGIHQNQQILIENKIYDFYLDAAGGVILHLDAGGDGLVLGLHQLHHVARVG
jgi:hypothetical protein